jgi:glucose uptake protein
MFMPHVYSVTLGLMILSMFSWGSWPNTQKATGSWRFELFYWDYVCGILLCAVVVGVTFGRTNAASLDSFFNNLGIAGLRSVGLALLGGAVFNLANLLLVAAIAIAGMAVAVPTGIGLALIIGSVLNYLITPAGNPFWLFGGIFLVVVAIVFDAKAYKRVSGPTRLTTRGIVLSLLCGVVMGLFYPFVAKALKGPGHLTPYTVAFVFAIGVVVSNFPLNYAFMRQPVTGEPVNFSQYFSSRIPLHMWGILGGIIWGVGAVTNFVASYAQMVGPATSYALGQGSTMVSAAWGVFVWKEFRNSDRKATVLPVLMFVCFLGGLSLVAWAPLIK